MGVLPRGTSEQQPCYRTASNPGGSRRRTPPTLKSAPHRDINETTDSPGGNPDNKAPACTTNNSR